jgi:6-phosphogluconate dehydrogenase
MSTCDLGLIGLAVMGQNLVLNMDDHGYKIAVYNRTTAKIDEFLQGPAKGTQVVGAYSIPELVSLLKRPRRVMLMVKAGKPVDDFIEMVLPYLEPGDIIIDGGNSNYIDSIRRTAYLESKGMLFIGTGISGGEEGARFGAGRASRKRNLSEHRCQSRGWLSVLRLGGRERRRAFRQDGA